MDIEARRIGDDLWSLSDLLQRPVGSIVRTSRGFFVQCSEGSVLADLERGPFLTIDALMAAVEAKTGSACRLQPR